MVGYATVTFVDGRSTSESERSIFNSKGGADVSLRESAAGRVLALGCPAWVASGDAGIVVSWSALRILGARHARPAADVLVLDRALAAISPGWVAELVAKVDAASEAEWPPGLEPDLFLAEFDRRAEIALANGAVTEADLALTAADTVALRVTMLVISLQLVGGRWRRRLTGQALREVWRLAWHTIHGSACRGGKCNQVP